MPLNFWIKWNVEIVKPIKPIIMSTCLNCKARITCGCQKRTASNGQQVCSSCLASYEAKLKANQNKQNK